MKLLVTTALCLGLSMVPAVAQTTSSDGAAVDSAAGVGITVEFDFVRLATSANILEIRSSELARDRASSVGVKTFAERMIADHTEAMQKLAAAAGQTAPDLATDLTAKLDPGHAEHLAALGAAEGEGFDQAYADLQRQAHEEAVALFQSYATNGEEGEVKAFAEASVPKLQEHLEMARELPDGS